MNYLTSIQNLFQFINDNWTTIIIIFGLVLSLSVKIKNYVKLSQEEKINIAKQQIKETMLKLVSDAEEDYFEWVSAGGIKRSQVIEKIFEKYPVLAKVAEQEEVIGWIDETIDDALKTMRDIFEKQKADCVESEFNSYTVATSTNGSTVVTPNTPLSADAVTSGYVSIN